MILSLWLGLWFHSIFAHGVTYMIRGDACWLNQEEIFHIKQQCHSGATDSLDGWIARNVPGQASVVGSFIDPVADKVRTPVFIFFYMAIIIDIFFSDSVPERKLLMRRSLN